MSHLRELFCQRRGHGGVVHSAQQLLQLLAMLQDGLDLRA